MQEPRKAAGNARSRLYFNYNNNNSNILLDKLQRTKNTESCLRLRANRFPPVYMAAGKGGDRRLCLVFANSVAYTSSNVIFHLRFIGIHHAFPTVSHKKYMLMRHKLSQNLQCGGFPFNPNFRTFRFGSTGILGTSFEGEPL